MLKKTTKILAEEIVKLCVNQDPAPNAGSGLKKIAQVIKEDIAGEQAKNLDEDLQFLYGCTHKQLQPLVRWIVYDPEDGKKRLRENLSKQKGFTSNFKYHAKRLVPQIIDEIHGFGSNVIVSGNHYREILEKVCDKLSVNYHPLITTERLEIELLKKVWDLELGQLTTRDIEQISLELVRTYNKYTDGVLRDASYRVIIPCVLYIAFLRILTENNTYFADNLC